MIKSQDYTRELLTIFFARKRTIFVTTLIFALLSLLVAFFWPPTYAAEGMILVKGKKREISPESLDVDKSKVSLIYEVTREDLSSEMNILTSLNVIENTVRRLADKQLLPDLDPSDPEAVRSMVADVRDAVKLELVPSSNLIEVSYLKRSPDLAVATLNELFAVYLQQRFQIYNPGEMEAFYHGQAKKYGTEIIALEDRLIRVAEQAATPEPNLEIQNNLIIKKDLEQQLVLKRNQVVEKRAHVDAVSQALNGKSLQLFSYLPAPSITAMAEKVQSLLVDQATTLSLYKPDSQKGSQLERQVDKAFETLKEEVTEYLRDQQSQLRGLEEQLSLQEEKLFWLTKRNVELNSFQIERGRIERELDLKRQSYKIFVKRWEETKINNSSEANNLFSINVLGQPTTSGKPVFPRKALLIPTGILAGFITGCCFGFIREYFDQTVKTPDDVRYYAQLPTIFSIPDWNDSSH